MSSERDGWKNQDPGVFCYVAVLGLSVPGFFQDGSAQGLFIKAQDVGAELKSKSGI